MVTKHKRIFVTHTLSWYDLSQVKSFVRKVSLGDKMVTDVTNLK